MHIMLVTLVALVSWKLSCTYCLLHHEKERTLQNSGIEYGQTVILFKGKCLRIKGCVK